MNAAPPQSAALLKPRPYKRFVTSAFHTRFVRAALLSLFVCWDLAICLAPKYDLFWSWFPIGPAGLRALLYFFSTVLVFILQVATLSIGKPTPTSPFQQVRQSLLSTSTLKTGGWYIASACWFTEVYIWCSSELTWVTRDDATSLNQLNERPIYFRAFFIMLAVLQAVKHVYFSQSTLQLPITAASQLQEKALATHVIPDTFGFVKSHAKNAALRSLAGSVAVTLLGPFIYAPLLRGLFWRSHLNIAKIFFTVARSSSRPHGIPPILGTMPLTIWLGFCLSMMWEFSALTLVANLRKPPVKDGQPWTSAGKDPNGSLLNGLKMKRGINKTFAFWELAMIAQNLPERRKVIFSDIDRPTGPVWSQMLQEALKVLQQIDDRIQPPQAAAPPTEQPAPTLPKILKPQLQSAKLQEQKGVVAAPLPSKGVRMALLDAAQSGFNNYGNTPDPIAVPVPLVVSDPATLIATAKSYFSWFFASSVASRVNATVLGSPHSDAATIVDAIEAITKMLIASLQDDAYGKAMAGVPLAVKQFTKTIGLIELVLQQNEVSGNIGEVEIIHGRLKAGLSELLSGFQMFLSDSGLGIVDLNAAKKASGQLAAEEEEQKRIRDGPRPRREDIEFEDAPPTGGEEQPPETELWRQWGQPKKTTKLFPQYEQNSRPRRQVSSGGGRRRDANGTATRSREMEQVR